jgi:hypothetical protein
MSYKYCRFIRFPINCVNYTFPRATEHCRWRKFCVILLKRLTASTNFQLRSQNCEKRQLASSCLSVYLPLCPSARNKSTPTRRIFIKFYTSTCEKYVEKFRVSLTSDENNGYFTWRAIYVFDHRWLIYFWNEKCLKDAVAKMKKRVFCNL